MRKLSIGVIGLGEVAQIIHLPILAALSDRFTIQAVCDISPKLVDVLGERYGVPGRSTDPKQLIDDEDLDCVLVSNSDEYHADCVVWALESGADVLVEKPMCLTPDDAQRIIATRNRTGQIVMVGYMRRFAPAFVELRDRIAGLERINYARVRDIIGQNRLIIDQTSVVERPDDVPAAVLAERRERRQAMVASAIGDVPDEIAATYGLLCGLGCHDLSAMRELLGPPSRVISARHWRGGRSLVALLEYDGYVLTYETGVDEQVRFDAHIEVYGDQASYRVQYDTPYVRHFPTVLHGEVTDGEALRREEYRPSLRDPYTYELEQFHSVVVERGVPKTGPEDFVADLELFGQIVAACQVSDVG